MSEVITIAGQKGGTGKSVTAVNLSASLALFGKKTLLIDCDPQGCSTHLAGISDLDYNCDISSVFSAKVKFIEAIVKTEFHCLDILPAGFDLFPVSSRLSKKTANEKVLRLLIKDISEKYDYIIIDSPSSYSFLSTCAMTAANWLVVCMTVRQSDLNDFHCLLKMIKYIRKTHDVPLKVAGVLFNRCESKEQIDEFISKKRLSQIEQMVYTSFIPYDEKIINSIELKVPIALHDIKSLGAQAYLNFAKEIHSSLGKEV